MTKTNASLPERMKNGNYVFLSSTTQEVECKRIYHFNLMGDKFKIWTKIIRQIIVWTWRIRPSLKNKHHNTTIGLLRIRSSALGGHLSCQLSIYVGNTDSNLYCEFTLKIGKTWNTFEIFHWKEQKPDKSHLLLTYKWFYYHKFDEIAIKRVIYSSMMGNFCFRSLQRVGTSVFRRNHDESESIGIFGIRSTSTNDEPLELRRRFKGYWGCFKFQVRTWKF